MKKPSPTLIGQSGAFEALTELAMSHPELPPAYIVVHRDAVEVQMDSLAALEAWRTALGVGSAEVGLRPHRLDARSTVEFTARVGSAVLHVYATAAPVAVSA